MCHKSYAVWVSNPPYAFLYCRNPTSADIDTLIDDIFDDDFKVNEHNVSILLCAKVIEVIQCKGSE